jgi:hypothetical protein
MKDVSLVGLYNVTGNFSSSTSVEKPSSTLNREKLIMFKGM